MHLPLLCTEDFQPLYLFLTQHPEPFNGQGLVSHLGHQGPSSPFTPPPASLQKCALCSLTSGLPYLLFSLPLLYLVPLPGQVLAKACFPQEASLCLNLGRGFLQPVSHHILLPN